MAVATSISTLESTLPMLELAGFQTMVFEDFYDILVSLVRQVVQPDREGRILSPELLLEAFQHPEGKFFMMPSLLRRNNLNSKDVIFVL